MRRWAAAVLAAALGLLSSCSGGSPAATSTTTSSTAGAPRTTSCAPASISASVDFTKFGGSSSTLAGAIVFRDTSGAPCALRGVPRVQVLAADGQPIPTFEAPGPARLVTAVVTPAAPGSTGAVAGSSITFSSWTCATHTMSLSVRFPGWAGPVSAAPTAASGENSPNPCSVATETDETIYIGPVAPISG